MAERSTRRSAKEEITKLAHELLHMHALSDNFVRGRAEEHLYIIETIAGRLSWTALENQLHRFRKNLVHPGNPSDSDCATTRT